MKPLLPLLSMLAACAPTLQASPDSARDTDPAPAGTLTIDASDYALWIYLDLNLGELVEPPDPQDSTDWDLGFQRFNIKLNGGISGTSQLEAAELPLQSFESVLQAPSAGYITDTADADEDGVPEYALAHWYDYDSDTHTLSAADMTYVLRAADGSTFKLRFHEYYSSVGTPAQVNFSWQELSP